MQAWFSLGRATLALIEPDRRLEQYVRREMDPYQAEAGPPPGTSTADVRIQQVAGRPPITELQGDAGDGHVSAVDDATLYLVDGERWWSMRLDPSGAGLTLGDGQPAWSVFGLAVRPLLQLALHRHGAVAVHASSASVDGRAVVVAGWSESGKTETVLAMLESGAGFISDKWTILGDDRQVAPFPAPVFLRRWVMRYLPRLRASLSAGARGHLLAGRIAAGLSKPVGRLAAGGPGLAYIAGSFERLVPVADRLRLAPGELRSIYGQPSDAAASVPLGALAILITTPGGGCDITETDATSAARRLARSGAFERRAFYELGMRAAYAGVETPAGPAADIEHETRFLEEVLRPVRVLEVRTPFPTDPRRVADAIARAL